MVLIDVKCDMIQVIISPHLVSKHKSTTNNQIALDIKDEVEDLEKGGIGVIQIDEATLREGLPLRKLEHAHYLDRVVHSLKTTIHQCWCSGFHSGVVYGVGFRPSMYDIHSPRIPPTIEIADKINKMLDVLEKKILWVNLDCGLKTCKCLEVKPAITNLVAATKQIRNEISK
ncbi:hypothetical protein RYX36_009844 [Vicia faba]